MPQQSCGIIVDNYSSPIMFLMNCASDSQRVVVEIGRSDEPEAEGVSNGGHLFPNGIFDGRADQRFNVVVRWQLCIEIDHSDRGIVKVLSNSEENTPVYRQYCEDKDAKNQDCK